MECDYAAQFFGNNSQLIFSMLTYEKSSLKKEGMPE